MKKKKKNYSQGLSTTIMVDVLFILLIFFVMVSTIKKDSISIKTAKVKKQEQTTKIKKKTKQYVLSVNKKNKIFVDNKLVKPGKELEKILINIKQTTPKNTIPVILLRPDASSSSSKLIEIFAALNVAKLSENVKIEIESEE